MAGGWVCEGDVGDFWVVYPNDDLHPHQPMSEHCSCNPQWDEGILVHNAFDGREAYEEGRRKVS